MKVGTAAGGAFVVVDATNAATATKLAATKNFSITGDITAADVAFDGSGNVALSATIDADTVWTFSETKRKPNHLNWTVY